MILAETILTYRPSHPAGEMTEANIAISVCIDEINSPDQMYAEMEAAAEPILLRSPGYLWELVDATAIRYKETAI